MQGLWSRGTTVRVMTLPDRFQDHDDMAKQYEEAELRLPGICTPRIAKYFEVRKLARFLTGPRYPRKPDAEIRVGPEEARFGLRLVPAVIHRVEEEIAR